ncbi:MAG: kinase [Clostridiales bacterium]|nr:kinase [Clostridiales bacterium]
MRLEKIQEALTKKNIIFTYVEDEGRGSLDFQFRGLRYHIWEFCDNGVWGVETNVKHAGRSIDIFGDYEQEVSDLILSWPDMAVQG